MSKKKKEKITYYDDNSTICDMSDVSGVHKKDYLNKQNKQRKKVSYREAFKTYCNAVKMMLGPMFVVLTILGILYLVCRLIFG